MSQKSSTSAKAMMDEVERLRAKNNGAFPTPRAVRDTMKGSQERAEHAILAVQIASGTLPHLRHTLPDEFQAELPPAAEILSLTPEAITDLPVEAQRMANGFFAAIGAAFRAQIESLIARVTAAETRYRDETEGMRAQLLGASRALDDQERTAEASTLALREEITALRVQVSTLAGKLASKETELAVRTQTHDHLLTQARDAAATADARLTARVTDLTRDLGTERDRCRTAEQHVARLTAANEAMQAELTRREADSTATESRLDMRRSGKAAASRTAPARSRHAKAPESVAIDG